MNYDTLGKKLSQVPEGLTGEILDPDPNFASSEWLASFIFRQTLQTIFYRRGREMLIQQKYFWSKAC